MPKANAINLTLPFYQVNPGIEGSAFGQNSKITFQPDGNFVIRYKEFSFQDGTLQTVKEPQNKNSRVTDFLAQKEIPVFSILAVILVILFRNLFFSAFQKYFLSLTSNYEIDFNIQKIGVGPILFSVSVILLTFSDFNPEIQSPISSKFIQLLEHLRGGIRFFVLPIAFSVTVFFFLNLTSRLFPLIFSDIKSLFALSLLMLIWNFADFGSKIQDYINLQNFIAFLGSIYLIIRTVLLFNVLRRSYRFHVPITLFYICVFNLGTLLLLVKGLNLDILSFYE